MNKYEYKIELGHEDAPSVLAYSDSLQKYVRVLVVNPALIRKQGLGSDRVEKILRLHIDRLELVDRMRELDPTKDLQELLDLELKHRENQYALQEAWGFSRDRSMHDWFEVPHCSCPKMDNRERKGTEYQIRSLDCIYHGSHIGD